MSSAKKQAVDKDYKALIERFPLRPIRNDSQLDIASDLISEIGIKGNERTQGEIDYMDALVVLVADYESRSPRIQQFLAELTKLSPQEILRSFLEEHGLSQSELSRRIACPQPVISDFLAGKRGLSKTTITKLADFFQVSADVFLPKPEAMSYTNPRDTAGLKQNRSRL